MKLPIYCPNYSSLSKGLSQLKIKSPRYKKSATVDESVAAIAIDSTGLKRFGHDEWHQEKYQVSAKRSWRKLHIADDNQHVIHASILKESFVSDDDVVQFTADGTYDKNPVNEIKSCSCAHIIF